MIVSKRKLHIVQLAGGKGMRAGGDIPKQFRSTGKGILFGVSLKQFLKLPNTLCTLGSIAVTAADGWDREVRSFFDEISSYGCPTQRVAPGLTRTASTFNALQALALGGTTQPEDLVAVHDAARPFASLNLLEKLVKGALDKGAAVPGIPVADTILQQPQGQSAGKYLNRNELVAVQTPQVFRWELLYQAHQWAAANDLVFTDDGSLVAARGLDPEVISGEQLNWKVTTDGDWQRAFDLLK